MFRLYLKGTLLFFITLLSILCPAFADTSQQPDLGGPYFDLKPQDTFTSFKARRESNLQNLRKQIIQTHPIYQNQQTQLTNAVVQRKIRIARERGFLTGEFEKGIAALYQKAVDKYAKKQFEESQKDFMEIDQLAPDYQQTRHYLQMLKVPDAARTYLKGTLSTLAHTKQSASCPKQLQSTNTKGGKN